MTATVNGYLPDPQDELQRRDALLSGVAEAAQRLLAIADFDTAVNGALEAIATAAGIDRIFIYQNHIDAQDHREFATCPYKWVVSGVVRASEIPGQFPMFYDEIDGYDDWLNELKAGRPVQKLAQEMSAVGQIKQKQEQALSILTVPIFIQESYWGDFGFDDCTSARVWSEAEISVLETAAANFAGALQRRENLADLENSNQQLQQRDALLNSVNAAAQCLVATDDLDQAIPKALQILGEGTRQDRVYVFENFLDPETNEVFWNVPYEWTIPDIPASIELSDQFPIAMDVFPSDMIKPFTQGKPIQFLTRDLGGVALNVNVAGQTQSLVAVPIAVAGQWWGVLGFDDCTTERVWSEAEIAVLETAATCIGNAIERDRNQKLKEATAQARATELEAHNRVLEGRDHILEATAKAANILLTVEDFGLAVNTALQMIGEVVDTDRVGLVEHVENPSQVSFGLWKVNYEWNSPHTTLVEHKQYPELMQGTYEGVEEHYTLFLRGEGLSFLINEISGPLRDVQAKLGVQAMHIIPILLQGEYWGLLYLDDCRAMRRRSDAELAALKTIADCIGSAIERERLRIAERCNHQAREAVERNVLLEREKPQKTAY